MDLLTRITRTIEPSLEAMGYRLVVVRFSDGKAKTLSVMAERLDDAMMSFDDCTEISRTVSALLDVEDPIESAYNLEVMSPGIDRPLTRPEDFARFAGYEAKMETLLPMDGRKRFKGVVRGIENDVITLGMPEGEVQIPFRQLRSAKLVVTEALIEAQFRRQARPAARKPGAAPKRKAKA